MADEQDAGKRTDLVLARPLPTEVCPSARRKGAANGQKYR
jgi:hypothetical protein